MLTAAHTAEIASCLPGAAFHRRLFTRILPRLAWVLSALAVDCLSPQAQAGTLLNPVRPDDLVQKPLDRRIAVDFASQLCDLSRYVAENYIRPVRREVLLAAALRGLYEALGRAAPSNLEEVIGRGVKEEYQLHKQVARFRTELGDHELLRGTLGLQVSLRTMLQSLDEHCAVLSSEELRRQRRTPDESGFGIELADEDGSGERMILSVTPGGPAQKAGLRPGDRISGMDATLASPAQLGTRKSRIRVAGRRSSLRPARTVELEAVRFQPETVHGIQRREDGSWSFQIDEARHLGYVRLSALDQHTPDELTAAMRECHNFGIRGLILDLRWCPSGYLESGRGVAELFLGESNLSQFWLPGPNSFLAGPMAQQQMQPRNARVEYRNGRPDYFVSGRATAAFTWFPMVVLVNSDTTGAAELVAAVLQDNRRALIAGQRTRGKGSVQMVRSLDAEQGGEILRLPVSGLAIKLTYGLIVRPNGTGLNRTPGANRTDTWGVIPDAGLECRTTAELSRLLRSEWQIHALRPPADVEALIIDDPKADPQLQFALSRLRRACK